MKKIILTNYIDFDFKLIGISSYENDYKLCWQLNRRFSFDFSRQKDLETLQPRTGRKLRFPVFRYTDPDTGFEYYLISNRHPWGNLVPEQKKTDYFMKIEGDPELIDEGLLVQGIRDIPSVVTAFPVNVRELRSVENIIF